MQLAWSLVLEDVRNWLSSELEQSDQVTRAKNWRHQELVWRAQVAFCGLPVMIHPQVVSHLMRNHKHGLKVVSLIDSARVVRMAHPGHPGQAYHAVLVRLPVIQVQTRQHQGVVPVLVVINVPLSPVTRIDLLLPPYNNNNNL